MKKIFILFALLVTSITSQAQSNIIYNRVVSFCDDRVKESNLIPSEKRQLLDSLASDISNHKSGKILFGCVTNSRRTQMSQIWLQTALLYYGINTVHPFSVGDVETEIPYETLNALRKSGFRFIKTMGCKSCYVLSIGSDETYIISSKKIKDSNVPADSCLLVSVCSDSEESTTFKKTKYTLNYESLISYDNTPSEEAKYWETNLQISREMLYLATRIKKIKNASK